LCPAVDEGPFKTRTKLLKDFSNNLGGGTDLEEHFSLFVEMEGAEGKKGKKYKLKHLM
jgi:hypothetical protein